MRFLMKVELDHEKANAAARNGTLGRAVESILSKQKPEAAYFATENGRRAGYLIVNMEDASRIPEFGEPWFLAFNASVEMKPVMVAEDLAKAGAAIEEAAKSYG